MHALLLRLFRSHQNTENTGSVGFLSRRYGKLGAVIFSALLSGCFGARSPLSAPPNPTLQCALSALVLKNDWVKMAEEQRFAVAVADITDPAHPDLAAINPYTMMYAASIPKLAILFGVMKRVDEGTLQWSDEIERKCEQMIQDSANPPASDLYHLAGPEYIAKLLTAPEYKLYDLENGGGLWIGKEYGKGPAQFRDPLKGLSHAATPFSLLRFYYLLDSGQLVSPLSTARMRTILSQSKYQTKLLRGLASCCPSASYLRKAGGWAEFDSDSALVSHGGKRYIVAGLVKDPKGEEILSTLAIGVDLAIHHPEALCATSQYLSAD